MQLGHKIKQDKTDKLISVLSQQLNPEVPRFVCSINSLRPLVDRLIVTDKRLVAVSASDAVVKWSARLTEVQDVDANGKWQKLTFSMVDGSRMKFGVVHPDDQDVIVRILDEPIPEAAAQASISPAGSLAGSEQVGPWAETSGSKEAPTSEVGAQLDAKEAARQARAEAKLERRQQKEAERSRRNAEADERERQVQEMVGRCVLAKTFAMRDIKLYANGYVSVGNGWFKEKHEKLVAISADRAVQEKSRGGRGMATFATMGVSTLHSTENFKAFLTIVTESETHSLQAEGAHAYKTALALATAGTALIKPESVAQAATGPVETTPSAPGNGLAEQLRDLATLHTEGVLSDAEFESAKAKLLKGS